MSRKLSQFTVQSRSPGRAYKTVQTVLHLDRALWCAHQYLVPGARYSVRILDSKGAVVMRATPKKAAS